MVKGRRNRVVEEIINLEITEVFFLPLLFIIYLLSVHSVLFAKHKS